MSLSSGLAHSMTVSDAETHNFYLFSIIYYLSGALQVFEPLLAPKLDIDVCTAAAQAQQRTRASRCGVRTVLCV